MNYKEKIENFEQKDLLLSKISSTWYKKNDIDLTKIGDFSIGQNVELAIFHALRNNYKTQPFTILSYTWRAIVNLRLTTHTIFPKINVVILNFGDKKSVKRIYNNQIKNLFNNNIYITSVNDYYFDNKKFSIKYKPRIHINYIYSIWRIFFKLLLAGKFRYINIIFYFIQSSYLAFYSNQLSKMLKAERVILSCPNCVGEKSFCATQSIKFVEYYQHGSILIRCSVLNSYTNSSVNIANLWELSDIDTFKIINTNKDCIYKKFNYWDKNLSQLKINNDKCISVLFLASNTSVELISAHLELINQAFNLAKKNSDNNFKLNITGYNKNKYAKYVDISLLNDTFTEINISHSNTTTNMLNESHIIICSDSSISYYLYANKLRFILISSGEHLYTTKFLNNEYQHTNPHSIAEQIKQWLK